MLVSCFIYEPSCPYHCKSHYRSWHGRGRLPTVCSGVQNTNQYLDFAWFSSHRRGGENGSGCLQGSQAVERRRRKRSLKWSTPEGALPEARQAFLERGVRNAHQHGHLPAGRCSQQLFLWTELETQSGAVAEPKRLVPGFVPSIPTGSCCLHGDLQSPLELVTRV